MVQFFWLTVYNWLRYVSARLHEKSYQFVWSCRGYSGLKRWAKHVTDLTINALKLSFYEFSSHWSALYVTLLLSVVFMCNHISLLFYFSVLYFRATISAPWDLYVLCNLYRAQYSLSNELNPTLCLQKTATFLFFRITLSNVNRFQ